MAINNFIFSLSLIIVFSCKNTKTSEEFLIANSKISITNLQVLDLPLRAGFNSYNGRINIDNQEIVFIDFISQKIHLFDTLGNELSTFLGKGDGPDKVGRIHYFIPYNNTKQFFIIDDFGFHHFENYQNKIGFISINLGFENKNLNKLQSNADPDETAIYYPEFYSPRFNLNASGIIDDYIYLPIVTEHPLLNAFMHDAFYAKTYSLGKFSVAENKLIQMGAHWPKVYLEHKLVPNLAILSFSIKNKEVFTSYAIDSTIHVFDHNLKPLYSFGMEGKGMKRNYRKTTFPEEAFLNSWTDLANQSVYGSIFVDNNLVFRVYYPDGYEGGTSRMQIYRDKILVGDVAVPQRFNVVGKIGEFYYADGIIDEENEKLVVFKFKI